MMPGDVGMSVHADWMFWAKRQDGYWYVYAVRPRPAKKNLVLRLLGSGSKRAGRLDGFDFRDFCWTADPDLNAALQRLIGALPRSRARQSDEAEGMAFTALMEKLGSPT